MTAEAPEKLKNGESRPLRVLFVCTGNTCRSPMAAAVFNDLMQKRGEPARATSAGLFADGSPISGHAAAALAAAGIKSTPENPYAAHISHTVSAADMTADLILTVSGKHAMALLLRFPEAAARISALPMDIPDPFGGDLAAYSACLAAIRLAVGLRFGGEA